MKDKFLREIEYLRLSVTDRCNLRCKYCMPRDGIEKKDKSFILSSDEIYEIVSAAASLGISKVRLTGGEPLVRRDIIEICQKIKGIQGISELVMTTNGTMLKEFSKDLKEVGVDRLNISLDTLDSHKYADITRGGNIFDVFDGIRAAYENGFVNTKINVVLQRGFNDDETRNFLLIARENKIEVRFIEIMPIGFADGGYISAESIITGDMQYIGVQGVARIFREKEALGTVGIVSPMSRKFCEDCNRIRVTADGKLKPCLCSEDEILIKGLRGEDLVREIKRGILLKPQSHHMDNTRAETKRGMSQIGG